MRSDLSSRWGWLIYALVLAALCAHAYGDAFRLGFTYDDEDYLANARKAHQSLRYLVRPDIDAPWASRLGVHLYVFAVYPLFGEDPAPYHLANVLFHLANALLLMALVVCHRKDRAMGFAAALLFLLNTMHYRAVLWISAVSLVLGLTFLLGSLLLFWQYIERREKRLLGGAFCCFAASALLHQAFAVAALFPLLLAAERGGLRDRRTTASLLFLLPGVAVLGIERWIYAGAYTGQTDYLFWGKHVLDNLAKYLFGTFAGTWLELVRITPSLRTVLWGGEILGVGVSMLLGYRPLRFWAAWTLLATLPFDLWARPAVFSRYFYFPMVGGGVITASGIAGLAALVRRRWNAKAASILLAALLGATAAASNRALFRLESVQYYDEGKYLLFEKRVPALAIPRLEEALRRDPDAPPKVGLWLAWAYFQEEEYGRAEETLEQLLEQYPGYGKARRLLGRVRLSILRSSSSSVPPPTGSPHPP